MLASIFIIIGVFYTVMLLNTNSLMSQVRDVFLWKIDCSETAGKPINTYNHRNSFPNEVVGKVDLTLVRLLTLHNFSKGYIWVWYSEKAYNIDGELITGSNNIITKWKIQKEHGEWEIIDIFESP